MCTARRAIGPAAQSMSAYSNTARSRRRKLRAGAALLVVPGLAPIPVIARVARACDGSVVMPNAMTDRRGASTFEFENI